MVKKIAALIVGIALTVWFMVLWSYRLPFFERYYLNAYARTSYLALGSSFSMLYLRPGNELALPEDSPVDVGERREKKDKKELKAWLRENVYNDQPLWRVFELPLLAGLLCLCLLLILVHKIENRSQSTLVRGPKVISKWAFWKRSRHGFYVETR